MWIECVCMCVAVEREIGMKNTTQKKNAKL